MELTYDWRSFQRILGYHRRPAPGECARADEFKEAPIYAVAENDVLFHVSCESEDFSRWIGQRVHDLRAEIRGRPIVVFEREQVEKLITGSLGLPHYYDQIEYLKKGAGLSAARAPRKGFLLEGIQGWWAKVLPSAYGALIRLEGEGGGDYLMLVRRGRLEGFSPADLSGLSRERRDDMAEVVKYLAERYWVPVQGLITQVEDWRAWSEAENPWKDIAFAIRSHRAKLVPFRLGLTSLIAGRAYFGV